MTIRVRAPATTANIGPGFDCAAAALDLWNELEVEEGDGEADPSHLGVRAFAKLAPVEGRSFEFVSRIPRERGLGSSAAVIAVGLVAGALAAGKEPNPEELLAVGVELEGHADNLAAALAGGVCLTWENRIVRVADTLPAVPFALVPEATVSTAEARSSLPDSVPHADAAFTAGRAALLGAALAQGSAELFAEAIHDRLHEPYRAANAPLLEAVRADLPEGALGATLSGSGPTVIVWVREEAVTACEEELARRFTDASVLRFTVTDQGAGAF
jgi:homoserine kinase